MKKIFLFFILLYILIFISCAKNKVNYKLPESVVFDNSGNIYVSNINGAPTQKNKKGYILKNNKIFIKGLNAPKGLYIAKGKLYICDIDRVVIASLENGRILKEIKIKGAKFLNDITGDGKHFVYFTDTDISYVYKLNLDNYKVSVLTKSIPSPNGIYLLDKFLYIVSFSSTGDNIFLFSLVNNSIYKSLRLYDQDSTGLDGITYDGKFFYISSYTLGYIYKADRDFKDVSILLKNLRTPADIFYFKGKLYIPLLEKSELITKRL